VIQQCTTWAVEADPFSGTETTSPSPEMSGAARSLTDSVVIVAPFECVWLTGDGLPFEDGKGCISFEVKGEAIISESF
jgi:hypothetical protein